MRKLVILKTLLDFLFLFLVFGSILLMIFIPIFIFSDGAFGELIEINGIKYQTIDAGVVSICVFLLLAYGLFVYSIFWFRKIVRLFMKTKLFDKKIIKGFRHIGVCFVLIAFFIHVPNKVYFFFNRKNSVFEFDLMQNSFFDSFFFMAALGLFFIVLGTVFKIAKHAKEENELTV